MVDWLVVNFYPFQWYLMYSIFMKDLFPACLWLLEEVFQKSRRQNLEQKNLHFPIGRSIFLTLLAHHWQSCAHKPHTHPEGV